MAFKKSKAENRAQRQSARNNRNERGRNSLIHMVVDDVPVRPAARKADKLEPQTETQNEYMVAIDQNILTFGLGPAGTGKTYVAVAMAGDALKNKEVEKIIITRPAVEAGESLGFLPGELDEKFDPYFAPVRQILEKRLGAGFVEYCIKAEKIVALPLAHMRGHTFENCWVILDEAQNTTPVQMKLFLTRIGEGCKVIVDGDVRQKDIQGASGLDDAINRLDGLDDVEVIAFTDDDIVRSGLVKHIVKRYES